MSDANGSDDLERLSRTLGARQLGLDAVPDAAALRALAIRRLAEVDFVPPWKWQQAVLVSSQADTQSDGGAWRAQFQLDEETRLRGDISEFAEAFFRLDLEERRRRWQALSRQCASHPALAIRMRELEPGLAIQSVEVRGTAEYCQLAVHVGELFQMHGASRAVRRRELLYRMLDRWKHWATLAALMRSSDAGIAALEPVLFQSLRRIRRKRQWEAWQHRAYFMALAFVGAMTFFVSGRWYGSLFLFLIVTLRVVKSERYQKWAARSRGSSIP